MSYGKETRMENISLLAINTLKLWEMGKDKSDVFITYGRVFRTFDKVKNRYKAGID